MVGGVDGIGGAFCHAMARWYSLSVIFLLHFCNVDPHCKDVVGVRKNLHGDPKLVSHGVGNVRMGRLDLYKTVP